MYSVITWIESVNNPHVNSFKCFKSTAKVSNAKSLDNRQYVTYTVSKCLFIYFVTNLLFSQLLARFIIGLWVATKALNLEFTSHVLSPVICSHLVWPPFYLSPTLDTGLNLIEVEPHKTYVYLWNQCHVPWFIVAIVLLPILVVCT